ncbi:hypothetical protein EXIGLDRAFT_724194 [Exidia glandulosa HHB12029]|uniref:Uncharacterized protein n=1 Tax=Exidia glandulosa HHB12029 TaxID=1314781 RepID=A0A165EI09_EXIGL|nr:hypothetical protein EXIGLDRAFT_724194 [Exidia glandulosa HHB12029]
MCGSGTSSTRNGVPRGGHTRKSDCSNSPSSRWDEGVRLHSAVLRECYLEQVGHTYHSTDLP